MGERRPGPVDGLGHVAQMLLGVVDVDDLDGVGKLLVGQVPDPGGAVAEDDLSGGGGEAAPLRLAMGALGEGGRLRVGVAAGRALNGGVVADRPRVAARPAFGVAPFGRPRRRQLDLAGLGGAVGLLAAAPGDLGRADRHAGPIQPQVHRGRRRRCGLFADGALVTGDFAAERLGATLDLPGLDLHPGQGRNNSLALAKLTSAAVMPTSRMTPGDSEVSCRSRARSRGQLPRRQAGQ